MISGQVCMLSAEAALTLLLALSLLFPALPLPLPSVLFPEHIVGVFEWLVVMGTVGHWLFVLMAALVKPVPFVGQLTFFITATPYFLLLSLLFLLHGDRPHVQFVWYFGMLNTCVCWEEEEEGGRGGGKERERERETYHVSAWMCVCLCVYVIEENMTLRC